MSAVDAGKVGALVFVASLVQASILGSIDLWGGRPDVLLVTVVAVALLRGTIVGSAAGFLGGLLFDLATLETLGLTSFALTLVGYWVGRYGETTGRDRAHAPYLSVLVVTAVYALALFVLHAVLGDAPSARVVLVSALVPAVVTNVVLAAPVHAVARRLLPAAERGERAVEVRLLG